MTQRNFLSRRKFINHLAGAAGVLAMQPQTLPGSHKASERTDMSIQQVIDRIIEESIGEAPSKTVDTFKTGDPSRKVTGITTTFLATCKVIQTAIQNGHNLIITHEPTFYNHLDEVEWLENNKVYQFKRKLLEEHQMVVWRCHDTIHAMVPDGIVAGMIKALGWESFADHTQNNIYHLPQTTLKGLAASIKSRFNISKVRVIGDPDLACERIGLMVGAAGGQAQISFMERTDPDVLVCGEIHEWETSEYIRDALFSGRKKGLIIMGHVNSEDAGMAWFAEWLREKLPVVPITHTPAQDPFIFL